MSVADEGARSRRTLVTALYASAVVTAVVAIVLGALVSPLLFAIALFGIADVWLARAYASGRLRMASGPRVARPEKGGVVEGPDADATDPSYNPYARED